MTDPISVEEEKKLFPTSYLQNLEKKDVIDPTLNEIKNNMVRELKSQILGLGQDIVFLKQKLDEFNEFINDDSFDDLYAIDPPVIAMKNYIAISKNYDLKREHFIEIMADGFIDFIDKFNILGIPNRTVPSMIDEGTTLSPEEQMALLNKAQKFIFMWKEYGANHNKAGQKIIGSMIYRQLANTEEKFRIINDKFFEMTGEYVLTTMKKDKEKTEDKIAEVV